MHDTFSSQIRTIETITGFRHALSWNFLIFNVYNDKYGHVWFFTKIWMSYATSQIQFRILCFVNKAWTCFCLHIFVILINNSFKSCFSVFIKCVINTMTQFILLVISHFFKIWLYSILIAKKKNTCTIAQSLFPKQRLTNCVTFILASDIQMLAILDIEKENIEV